MAPTPPPTPKMFQGSDDGPGIDRPVRAGDNTPRQIAMRTSGPLSSKGMSRKQTTQMFSDASGLTKALRARSMGGKR